MSRSLLPCLTPFAACAALLLSLLASPTSAQWPTPEIIEVDGLNVRVMTAGFEHLEQGRPVVVLESGGGPTIQVWYYIFDQVAEFAPVVAYERPGVGESEFDGAPRSMDRTATQLRALLAELGVPPPYVLVGHSLGGPYIRNFAGRFPEEIAGLVYVDPTDFTQRPAEQLEPFTEIGVADPEAALEEVQQVQRDGAAQSPEGVQADIELFLRIMAAEPEELGFRPAPTVPTAVIAATEPEPLPPGWELSFDDQAYQEALGRQRARSLGAWVLDEPEGLFFLVTHAGHNTVLRKASHLVADVIQRVVFPDITRQLRAAVEEGGGDAASATYRMLKHRYPPERFDEHLLEVFGWDLLREERIDDATAIFELNTEEYPESAYLHYSLGHAHGRAGRLHDARGSFERAVALAKDQGDPSLATYQASLERVVEELESG